MIKETLYDVTELEDEESSYRAKVILLKDEGHAVPEIRGITNHHDVNMRKWIHRFNEKGIEGIMSRKRIHKPIKTSDNMEKKIVEMAVKSPRDCHGLPFSTWSLRVLAGYTSRELSLVDSTSHTEIRNTLKHCIRYRQSKVTLGDSMDPGCHLKKSSLKN